MIKKIFKAVLWVALVIVVLLGAFLIALQSPRFQTYLAQRATAYLSGKLQTKVAIERVKFSFFNEADLVNFYLEDYNGDTLIAAKELDVKLKLFSLLNRQAVVHSILLEGATVHLHRDSTGTKMNLVDVFKKMAGPPANVPAKPADPFTWKIDLWKLEVNNTDFRYLDEKGHLDLKARIPTCQVNVKDFDLNKKVVNIRSVGIEKAYVSIDLLKREKKTDNDTTGDVHFLPADMQLNFDGLTLVNSRFSLTDYNADTILPKGMDFKHLDISGINLFADKGSIQGDTILAKVNMLTARDRSGFVVQNLVTDARVSTQEVILKDLDLKTPDSRIQNYLAFKYAHFRDFKDFFNKVTITATLKESTLSLRDLNYFVRKLDAVEHNAVAINGNITGRINNLKGKNIDLRLSESTFFNGNFSTRGLPNIYETSLNLRVNRMATTVEDIRQIYPAAKMPPNFKNLGLMYFTGSLDGFVTDFVTNGRLVTSIGTATSDLNFKYNKDTRKSAYSGQLALNEFDLGKFFGDEKNLGKVSMKSKITGGGLTLETLNADLTGSITSITLRGYNYKDIKADGSVVKKSFTGKLDINDPNLVMVFNGKVDITRATPEFNFSADIKKARLKQLNLLTDSIDLQGSITSNFSGNKIDNFVGSLKLDNFTLSRDTVKAYLQNLTLDAHLLSTETKRMKLKADFGEAEIAGNFTLKALPRALLDFTRYTFTRDIADSALSKETQDFTFDVNVYNPGNLTRVITPRLYAVRNVLLKGEFNSVDQQLKIKGSIDDVVYDKYAVKTVDINGNAAKGFFDFNTAAGRVYMGDSLLLDKAGIMAKTLDNRDIKFNLYAANSAKNNYADVTAYLTPQINKAVIRLEPSDIKLANYNWKFDPGNYIQVEGKKIITHNLVFRSAEQTIYIAAFLKNDTSTCIKLTLDNTSVSDFAGLFTSKIKDLKGSINGKLQVDDVFTRPRVFADLVVEEFKVGNELVGDINIESKLDESGKSAMFYATIRSLEDKNHFYNDVVAKGVLSIDAKNPSMEIDVNAKMLNLNFLNYTFFNRYVKDVRGIATANVKVYGSFTKPLLKGDVVLVNDTVTVSFINTRYHVLNQRARLDEHGFNLSGMTLLDINNNEIYTTTSRINHESFRKFALDLYLNATNGVQFLNLTEKQSPYFYGVAYNSGEDAWVRFNGPINTPRITAFVRTGKGTHCRLPVGNAYETNKYGFYKFVNKDLDTVATVVQKNLKLNGVDFAVDLEVTPDARMDIILDPVSGDILTSYGTGFMQIKIPRGGNIRVDGLYTIQEGTYDFSLQGVIKKHFELNKGGTVEFNGDAYKAQLNVDAVYERRAAIADLISDMAASSTPAAQSAAQARIPIKLFMHLTGILEKPTVAFEIQAIDPDPSIKSLVDLKLNWLKNNEGEMNKQVFGLLVMNRFLPQQTISQTLATSSGGAATNTVSQLISSQLSTYLSSLLDNTLAKNLDISLGFNQYDQNLLTTAVDGSTPVTSTSTRQELQLALQQRLLNNRLIINAGANLDIGNTTIVDAGSGNGTNNPTNSARTVIPTGDFQIEYVLTPQGEWRIKAFNRTNYDYYTTRNTNRTGIGISYSKEFDKPAELFEKPKNKRKERREKKKNEVGNATPGTVQPLQNVIEPPIPSTPPK